MYPHPTNQIFEKVELSKKYFPICTISGRHFDLSRVTNISDAFIDLYRPPFHVGFNIFFDTPYENNSILKSSYESDWFVYDRLHKETRYVQVSGNNIKEWSDKGLFTHNKEFIYFNEHERIKELFESVCDNTYPVYNANGEIIRLLEVQLMINELLQSWSNFKNEKNI